MSKFYLIDREALGIGKAKREAFENPAYADGRNKMRLIDADALTDKAEILYQHTTLGKIIPWSAVRVCEINNIKTIEAEPVRHGEWLKLVYDPAWTKCSECGCNWELEMVENCNMIYCPNCGAKMDGGNADGR